MGRLLLVRHAQASFSSDPSQEFKAYDQLSELGQRQSTLLGAELLASGMVPDHVFVGPLKRHQQTHNLVADVFRGGGEPWPEPSVMEPLREHQGARIVRRALSDPTHDEHLAELVRAYHDEEVPEARRRIYFRAFRRVTRQWAQQTLPASVAGGESWRGFRDRVAEGLHSILDTLGPKESALAFTSGGPVGSAVATMLELDDERALELGWMVQNATVTELRYDGLRATLRSFNVHPRLGNPEMVTDV